MGGYAKGYAKDSKGKEISCDQVQSIVNAAIAADPWLADEIIDAVIQAAPMLADCITRCPPFNNWTPPYVIAPLTPQEPVSPEQPPITGGRD
jgi:hypothetical protein